MTKELEIAEGIPPEGPTIETSTSITETEEFGSETHPSEADVEGAVQEPQTQVEADEFGEYIEIECGLLGGRLYLEKFGSAKKRNVTKCVMVDDKWVSLSEFEAQSGKKSKNWRKSVKHQGISLNELVLETLTQRANMPHSSGRQEALGNIPHSSGRQEALGNMPHASGRQETTEASSRQIAAASSYASVLMNSTVYPSSQSSASSPSRMMTAISQLEAKLTKSIQEVVEKALGPVQKLINL